MKINEENRNRQQLLGKTDRKSTTHPFARIWKMKCAACSNIYGSNSCDAHIRRCPKCMSPAAAAEPLS